MNTTTEQSSKAEIISHACELVDDQQNKINQLIQQRTIHWSIITGLVILLVF